MYLLLVSVHQFGGFADTLGCMFGDPFQQLRVLRTQQPTEFSVRSKFYYWLVIEGLAPLRGFESGSACAGRGDHGRRQFFERRHNAHLFGASYSGQSHEPGPTSSDSRLNRS